MIYPIQNQGTLAGLLADWFEGLTLIGTRWRSADDGHAWLTSSAVWIASKKCAIGNAMLAVNGVGLEATDGSE